MEHLLKYHYLIALGIAIYSLYLAGSQPEHGILYTFIGVVNLVIAMCGYFRDRDK